MSVAVGRAPGAAQARSRFKHGASTAQPAAEPAEKPAAPPALQPAAQPAAQFAPEVDYALLGELLHAPAFSAAADPRLASVESLRVRTAVVGSDINMNLRYSIAEAQYALGFDQTILRCQLVAVWSPRTDRWYLPQC